MNVPHSWSRMTGYQKAIYLVNTHQAKDMREAGQILSRARRRKQPEPCNPQPLIRLPYKDQ